MAKEAKIRCQLQEIDEQIRKHGGTLQIRLDTNKATPEFKRQSAT